MASAYDKQFFITLIAVCSFAGLGTFIRTGLSLLFAHADLLSLLPNLVGSFMLGLLKGMSLQDKYINAGIGTGLCGSVTTFSSYNYEMNVLLVSKTPDWLLAIIFIAATFIGSAVCYFIGETLSNFVCIRVKSSRAAAENEEKIADNLPEEEIAMQCVETVPKDTKPEETHIVDYGSNARTDGVATSVHIKNIEESKQEINRSNRQFVIWVCIFITMNAIVIPLCFAFIDDRLWLAALFAPIGAALRWILGLKFNKNNSFNLPVGTFAANIIGSLLLTLLIVISEEPEDPRYESLWIEATTKGFCGCLSTVSSFISELYALRREDYAKLENTLDGETETRTQWREKGSTYRRSLLYFFATIIVAQLVCSVPNGIAAFH